MDPAKRYGFTQHYIARSLWIHKSAAGCTQLRGRQSPLHQTGLTEVLLQACIGATCVTVTTGSGREFATHKEASAALRACIF